MALSTRELLAKTLQAEAGGEGFGGMLAAGAVIANRAKSKGYGSGIDGVIMKPGQFSAWNGVTGYAGGEGAINMDRVSPSSAAYAAADAILSGNYKDPTGGATHYYNPSVANPAWGKDRAGGDWEAIGNHIFGRADAGKDGSPQRTSPALPTPEPNTDSVIGIGEDVLVGGEVEDNLETEPTAADIARELLKSFDTSDQPSPVDAYAGTGALDTPQSMASSLLQQIEPQREVVATTPDGGYVYKGADGALSYTSPGYATNDPAAIARIMEGATPADLVQGRIDDERIAANPIASRALKAVEGVPFVGSYADEAVGAFSPQAGANMQANSAAMERQNPGQSTALKIAGSVAGAVPMALAAAPAIAARAASTVGGQALQAMGAGAAAGAAEGAIYGAGEQQGSGRLKNAKDGGLFGAGLGAAFGAAAPFVSKAIKVGLANLKGSDVGAIAKTLGVSAPAARVIKNALDAGDMDEAAAALARAGDGAMLADAGQPARELLDAAANAGGNAGRIAREAVDERTSAASVEMQKALDDALGPVRGVETSRRAVREGTADARNTAYEAAYSKPIDYSTPRGRTLEGMLRTRVPESAYRRANELMRLDGDESAQKLFKIGDDGKVSVETLPDVRQIDYLTRALRDVADEANGKGKMGGQTDLGRSTAKLATDIRNIVKGAVPEYKVALDTAADAIAETNAIKFGSELFRPGTTREAVRDTLDGATKAELEAAKQGLRSHIDDTLANVARTITDPDVDAREGIKVLRDFSSRANKAKLQMLLGPKQADALLEKLDKEAVAFELRAAIAMNSKTAIRGRIQGSVDDQTASGALELLGSGEPLNAGKRFVQIFTGNTEEAKALRQSGLYEEIATALTQTRGRKAEAALRYVKRAMAGQKITEQQAAFIGQTIATGGFLAGNRATSTQLSKLRNAQ